MTKFGVEFMRRVILWAIVILVVAAVGVAGGMYLSGGRLPGGAPVRFGAATGQGESITQTVEIRPADSVIGRVSAAGNIALSSQQQVVLEVGGVVHQVHVKPGDLVEAGGPLVTLDTTELERSLRRAELNFQTAQNSLAQLQEPADADELAQAEAQLLSAQANLEDVKAGPSSDEIAAARAKSTSAWAAYQDLTNGMSDAQRTSMEAQLRTAQVALQVAQRAYDKIAWQGDAGMSTQAADLQNATIEYERVKAEYEIQATTSEADVQSALSSARETDQQLNDLLNQPTPAQIADAEAQVAGARATLEQRKRGANQLELEAAQIQVESALVDLEEAHTQLKKTQVKASTGGTVMEVHAEAGQQLPAGEAVVVLADTSQLELPVLVAEVDIDEVTIGQAAEITIDALLGRPFEGTVARIAPASDSASSVVNYQVVISLTDDDLRGVRPGMTAIAELVNSEASAGWLVPTTAITQAGGETVVTVLRAGQPVRVRVAPGGVQGEWTVVQSADLHAGDQVVGTLASYVAEDAPRFGPGGGGGPRGGD
jgi:HlyD family secretion protein